MTVRRSMALVLFVLASAAPTLGACPGSVCDCLGAAGRFAVVGIRDARIGGGRLVPRIAGDACAPRLTVRGARNPVTNASTQSLIATDGPGSVAARVRGFVFVFGDVATGGGEARISTGSHVSGNVDTSGTHSDVAPCAQAALDVESAAGALAALAPTRDLGDVSVRATTLVLSADPGVNVWTASRIRVVEGTLQVALDPATDAVIINTPVLRTRRASVTGGAAVVINVTGAGPAVVLRDSLVSPHVLAAGRVVRAVTPNASTLYARRVRIRAGEVEPVAPCSTSGAFLGAIPPGF